MSGPIDVDLEGCLAGRAEAWEAFVARTGGLIRAAAPQTIERHRGRASAHEIDEVIQDVYLRLLKNDCHLLRSYDPARASLSTWLTIVARSATIDRARRRVVPTLDLEAAGLAAAAEAPEPTETPGLPPIPDQLLTGRQRLVLSLLYDNDLTVREVAVRLGVNEQTIRSTRHKAMLRLRSHFGVDDRGDTAPAPARRRDVP